MKLHRTSGRPDWEGVKAGERNWWQRLAASTGGVATPGNAVTVIGFAIVLLGLAQIMRHHYWAGGVALAVGRALDIADGWLAELTGTKSPLGETLDAGLDKIGTLLTLIVFFYALVAPWWVLVVIALPHATISIIVLRAQQRGTRIHPSRIGKLSMAVAWFSLLGFVVVRGTSAAPESAITIVVYVLAIVSTAMGLYAALGYALGWN